MKHVFLSYAREDAATMRRVRDLLTDEGIAVWSDENLTPGTASWQTAIEKALEAAGCVVVLLSPDARGSQWVTNELSYAATHEVAVFPALVRGDERDAVPIQLINAQRVDARQRFLAAMQQLVDAVRDHLQKLEHDDELPSADSKIHWTERSRLYAQFWKMLQQRSKGRTTLFTDLTGLDAYFLSISAGRKGFKLGYVISMDWGSVNLYIDSGYKEKNKAYFDALYAHRDAAEAAYGAPLDWLRLDNKRSSQITHKFTDGGLDKRESWPALQDRMIDAMIRLDNVFRRVIAGLKD